MNEKENILHFMESTMKMSGIHVHWLKEPYKDIEFVDLGFRSTKLNYNNYKNDMIRILGRLKENRIYFFKDIYHCHYIDILLPDKNTVCIVGPILFDEITDKNFDSFFPKTQIDLEIRQQLINYYTIVPLILSRNLLENFFISVGKILFGDNCQTEYEDFENMFYYETEQEENFSFDFRNLEELYHYNEFESELLLAIKLGDETTALNLLNMEETRTDSVMMIRKEVRRYKNNAMCFNAILRKTLEKEHVHPISNYYMEEQFMSEIERCTTTSEIRALQRKMISSYCKMVREKKYQEYPQIISKMLTYIDANPCADLKLKNFAKMLNFNANYLSELFSKEIGMTLTEYVHLRRLQKAKQLLEHTDLKMEFIAKQCGFSNSHYFIRIFKKYTGITPKQYRETYLLMDNKEMFNKFLR